MKSILLSSLAGLTLLGLAACGGGGGGGSSPSPAATGNLTYVDPSYQDQPFQFALVKDPASTSSNLVLDVVGPTGTGYPLPAVGITFGFLADATKVAWGTSPVVTNGTTFPAGNYGPLAQGWVSAGGYLQGLVANKGLTANALVADVGTGVIAKITLTPVAGATAGTVTLKDTGLGNFMDNSGPPALPIQFSVGTLTLN
jgi:hypothetical protein